MQEKRHWTQHLILRKYFIFDQSQISSAWDAWWVANVVGKTEKNNAELDATFWNIFRNVVAPLIYGIIFFRVLLFIVGTVVKIEFIGFFFVETQ